jgi:hypothetical protein
MVPGLPAVSRGSIIGSIRPIIPIVSRFPLAPLPPGAADIPVICIWRIISIGPVITIIAYILHGTGFVDSRTKPARCADGHGVHTG